MAGGLAGCALAPYINTNHYNLQEYLELVYLYLNHLDWIRGLRESTEY